MSDDAFSAALVAIVLVVFVAMATCTESCAFTAYDSCMRNHSGDPAACEKLLPLGWQR